jgi:rubrerythrin
MKKNLLKLMVIIAGIALITSCGNNKPTEPATPAAPKKTIENLKAAIKGETTASAKYAAYAEKAKEEGFMQIAVLFRATSKSEEIHAQNHTKVLTALGETMEPIKPEFEVKTTKENLEDAVKGEKYEVETMYPDFIKTSTADTIADATNSFYWAMNVEKNHANLYQIAIDALAAKNLSKMQNEYFVCSTCGNTFAAGKIDELCAICATAKDKYISIK